MEPLVNREKEEIINRERREQRLDRMKQQKKRQELFRKNMKRFAPIGIGAICVGIAVFSIFGRSMFKHVKPEQDEMQIVCEEQVPMEKSPTEQMAVLQGSNDDEIKAEDTTLVKDVVAAGVLPEEQELVSQTLSLKKQFDYKITKETKVIPETEVISKYAVLIDASTDEVVAMKLPKERMNPASMTKIMTVLVAAEHVKDLDEPFTITLEMTDYAYVNDCSSAGFLDGETVTIRDLFYGTILPSGGEAALALATYVAGSHEAFVEMMNEKLEELGLADTAHFTNCVGLYDTEHYCSVYDMAVIIDAAIDNELCREVMSAHTYTTSKTPQHPDGITISNWFLRRIEDKETGGEVLCAKTGFVNQSGSCAASYFEAEDGTPYICVTAKSSSSWKCIYDQVALYSKYALGHKSIVE